MTAVAALYVDARGPYPKLARGDVLGPIMSHGIAHWSYLGKGEDLDCWDESRDARLYDGPHPIVAHPPCKHWGRLSHLAHVECACGWKGKAKDTIEICGETFHCPQCEALALDDSDCAPRAVEHVRRWGGVLEHPAGSKLWLEGIEHPDLGVKTAPFAPFAGELLPLPRNGVDSWGGYTIEVDQCEWGHVARKRTWLYLVGVPREALEDPPFPGREPTHWISGFRRRGDGSACRPRYDAAPPGIKICSSTQRRRTPPLFAEYLVRLARAAVRP